MSTRKYPFLGLNELSNITSTFPTGTYLYGAIPRRDRAVTYTPTDCNSPPGGDFACILPSMSTYKADYNVLKEYQIVPLQPGAMQRNQRLSLAQFADARTSALAVDRPNIQRIFIPLKSFPTPRRGRIIELITFLNSIRTINRGEIAFKASKLILKRIGAVHSAISLAPETPSEAGKFWLCCAWVYDIRMQSMLKSYSTLMFCQPLFALNRISRSQLAVAFAKELQEQCFSLPRLITHAGRLQVSDIEVVILSEHRMATLIANARRRCLQESECTPMLAACQVNLGYLSNTTSDARLLTTFTPKIELRE